MDTVSWLAIILMLVEHPWWSSIHWWKRSSMGELYVGSWSLGILAICYVRLWPPKTCWLEWQARLYQLRCPLWQTLQFYWRPRNPLLLKPHRIGNLCGYFVLCREYVTTFLGIQLQVSASLCLRSHQRAPVSSRRRNCLQRLLRSSLIGISVNWGWEWLLSW